MKPIRGERHREEAYDPWAGQGHCLGQQITAHMLSDAGAIESLTTGTRIACCCGCLKPAGGFCAVCLKPVCVDCFTFCQLCHKPVCPRDSLLADPIGGNPGRVCIPCGGAARRRKVFRRIGHVLLSPFVKFEDNHEG